MKKNNNIVPLQLTLAIALFVVLAIIFTPTTGTGDINMFVGWGVYAYDNSVASSYAVFKDNYPPLAFTILYAAVALSKALGISPFYGVKIMYLFFLTLSIAIIYMWTQRNIIKTIIFSIPLTYSCLFLGYMDICFAGLLLLSVYFLNKENLLLANIFFTTAALIKFAPLIVAPFILTYALWHSIKISKSHINAIKIFFVNILVPPAIALFVLYLFFGDTLLLSLQRSFPHKCLTCNALNFNYFSYEVISAIKNHQNVFWAIINQTKLTQPAIAGDETQYAVAHALFNFFYISTFIVFLTKQKSPINLMLFCIIGHMAYFTFSAEVHENHLYLSMLIAMAIAIIDERYLMMALSIALISSVNLFLFYGFNGLNPLIEPDWTAIPEGFPYNAKIIMAIFETFYFLMLWSAIVFFPGKILPTVRPASS